MRAREPGQVRKEAALSGSEHVPRPSLARAKRHASARGPLSRMGRTVHFFLPGYSSAGKAGMSSAVFRNDRGQLPDLRRGPAATAARAEVPPLRGAPPATAAGAGAAVGAAVAPASAARTRAGAAVGGVVMVVM